MFIKVKFFNFEPSSSVADPGCLSRIPIFTRIQKQKQKRGVKKNKLSYLFCSHKFRKIENIFSFEMLTKKIWANFQRIIELFYPKIAAKLSKIWVWDPGPRGQKGTGSRIQIRNIAFKEKKISWPLCFSAKSIANKISLAGAPKILT